MTTDAHRIKLLKELLAERILVLDGAFGTFVLGQNLSAADYRRRSIRRLQRKRRPHPPGADSPDA